MFSRSILLLASAALSMASPVVVRGSQASSSSTEGITLPSTGTSTDLPAPPPGLSLKSVALGLGIQNYTCAHIGADPVATGALAVFYDATPLFAPQSPSDPLSLPPFAVNNLPIPLNLRPLPHDKFAASPSDPFPADAPLRLSTCQPDLPILGHHFFDAQENPVFDLPHAAIHLVAAKDASVNPPPSADQGPEHTGAVPWLKLSAKDGAASTGATLVYRVLTAGGNPHGCSNLSGQDSTPYSALYYFFG